MDKNTIRGILEKNNYMIVVEKRYKNSGYRLKMDNGSIVMCYDNGTYYCQGKKANEIEQLLENEIPKVIYNNRVFVVYGHDTAARDILEVQLRRWNIEPLLFEQLPTEGRTIIEQLEKYIPQANFGIVLATPDDFGYARDYLEQKKLRPRMNVILELGMLIAKLGRNRVFVIIKRIDDFETPSDIHGIIYHSFTNDVSEVMDKLARELKLKGYNIT